MQVIEKVKVAPEGYNGAGMNYDGGNRQLVKLLKSKIVEVTNKEMELFKAFSSLFYLSKF